MKKNLLAFIAMTLCACTWTGELRLWYSQPARAWTEALPIGNSRLGAMVFGGTEKEELQLNEETFWAGSPYNNDNPNALYVLPAIRKLVFSGKNNEAQRLVDANFQTGKNGMSYLTMGSVFMTFPGHGNASRYRRDLDIGRAVSTTTYEVAGVSYTRTAFASLADNVIIMNIWAGKDKALNFTIGYDAPLRHEVRAEGEKLHITCHGRDQESVKGCLPYRRKDRRSDRWLRRDAEREPRHYGHDIHFGRHQLCELSRHERRRACQGSPIPRQGHANGI